MDEKDPRAKNVAKVVPTTAKKRMLGAVVLGYTKEPGRLRKPLSWSTVTVMQRKNELARLVQYRLHNGLDAGPPIGWAAVLANLSATLGDEVTVDSVADLCRRIGLPEIDAAIVAGLARDPEKARRVWTKYELLDAASTGALIEMTSVEREELEIKRIDAWDETADDRRRRLTRERKRKCIAKKRQQS
ncbi:hypothetical protein [Mesorhizobium sp. L-8-10]|uniref:hypothetical protein n=1 Tax=Mesorhizobium sp. L-8-10 TaxID=2744523 RepID=UPI001925DFDB|nr:hypothetical protein [Mesorhizobium sp. L-8-10]